MKNVFLIASFLICFASFAQGPRGNNDRQPRPKMERPDFTPEQLAELHTKKLTLELDLDEKQQAKVFDLELKAVKDREAHKTGMGPKEEMTDEEKFEKRSAMLDAQIEYKSTMRSILNKDQFEKWEKTHKARGKKRQQEGRRGKKHEKRQ
jgi:hypothetical protein